MNEPVDQIEMLQIELPDAPYPGLRPFQAHEWSIYFGRERMVADIISNLVEKQFILVHGDSACGKSSLVRAGVQPRLEVEHSRGGATWRSAIAEPGRAPLRNLAEALARLEAEEPSEDTILEFRRLLNRGGEAWPQIAQRVRRGKRDNICLLVDQFEEIFAFDRRNPGSETMIYIDVLVGLQQLARDRERVKEIAGLHVIITMRSEFLGRCARYPGLAETINETQYLVPQMERQALVRAICDPAELYGGRVEREVAHQLIADVGRGQDMLPLIQHAMMLITRDKLGGEDWTVGAEDYPVHVSGEERWLKAGPLLSHHAEEVAAGAAGDDPRRAKALDKIFQALTDLDADGNGVRRKQSIQELEALVELPVEDVQDMLRPLRADGVSFLRPYGEEDVPDHLDVDISHEALIRSWERVAGTADAGGARKGGLLQREFEDGLSWKTLQVRAFQDPPDPLPEGVAGDRRRWLEDKNAAWADRYGGEWDLVADFVARSEETARKATLLKFGIITASIVAVFAIIAAVVSFIFFQQAQDARVEEQKALQERNEGRARLLAQRSIEETGRQNSRLGLRIATTLLNNTKELPFTSDAEVAAYAALGGYYRNWWPSSIGSPVSALAYSQDGKQIAFARADTSIEIWDTQGRAVLRNFNGLQRAAAGLAYSRDGSSLAAWNSDGQIKVWDSEKGVLTGSRERLLGTNSVAASPDGTRFAILGPGPKVRLWDSAKGSEHTLVSGQIIYEAAAFSPDGEHLALGDSSSFEIHIWSLKTSTQVARLAGYSGFSPIAYAPDGRTVVAAASRPNLLTIWDAISGTERASLEIRDAISSGYVFSPDGTRLAAWGTSGGLNLWETAEFNLVKSLNPSERYLTKAVFSADSNRVIVGDVGGVATLVNARDGSQLAYYSDPQKGAVKFLTFDPAGQNLALGYERSRPGIWSVSPILNTAESALPPAAKRDAAQPSLAVKDLVISPSQSGPAEAAFAVAGSAARLESWNGQDFAAPSSLPLNAGKFVKLLGLIEGRPLYVVGGLQGEEHGVRYGGKLVKADFSIAMKPYLSDTDGSLSDNGRWLVSLDRIFGRLNLFHLTRSEEPGELLYDSLVTVRPEESIPFANPDSRPRWKLHYEPTAKVITGAMMATKGKGLQWISHLVTENPRNSAYKISTIPLKDLLATEQGQFTSAQIEDVAAGKILYRLIAPAREADSASDGSKERHLLAVFHITGSDKDSITFVDPKQRVVSATITPEANRIAWAGEDGSVGVYSLALGGLIARFNRPERNVVSARVAADGKAVYGLSSQGTIIRWQMFSDREGLKAAARSHLSGDELTDLQLLSYLPQDRPK